MQQPRPRGRRPGATVTRDAIAQAARELFADQGYDRAGVRAIAARAGVDPRLVTHHFGSKQQLFVQVMGLPVDPGLVVGALAGDPAGRGERLARVIAMLLDDPASRDRMVGFVRAASTEPAAAAVLRHVISSRVVAPVAAALGGADAALGLELAAAQLLGVVLAREIVQVEPLATADPSSLVALLAPALQAHLGGLPGAH